MPQPQDNRDVFDDDRTDKGTCPNCQSGLTTTLVGVRCATSCGWKLYY